MHVAVMQIGVVWVAVQQWGVGMGQFIVGMIMAMILGQMQPQADRHEHPSDQQLDVEGFAEEQDREPAPMNGAAE
jgi:hypothetical protein